LEGEFVYAWDGTELVLLPVDCTEYKSCTQHTLRLDKKVQAKDVKPGYSYVLKNGTSVLYLGRFPYNEGKYSQCKLLGTRHVFLDLDNSNPKYGSPYIVDSGFTKLAESVSTNALPQYPDELDRFLKSEYNGDFVSVIVKSVDPPDVKRYRYNDDRIFIIKNDGGELFTINLKSVWSYSYGSEVKNNYIVTRSEAFIPKLKDGRINFPAPGRKSGDKALSLTPDEVMKLDFLGIYAVNSKGIEVKVLTH
jgi:hypothetical protein